MRDRLWETNACGACSLGCDRRWHFVNRSFPTLLPACHLTRCRLSCWALGGCILCPANPTRSFTNFPSCRPAITNLAAQISQHLASPDGNPQLALTFQPLVNMAMHMQASMALGAQSSAGLDGALEGAGKEQRLR